MILEFIATETASHILGRLMDWGYKKLNAIDYTPYEKELKTIILHSIKSYSEKYPIKETDKIAFYESQALMNELFKFRFTSNIDVELFHQVLESDIRILPPSERDILNFFEIFNINVESSEKLKALNIEYNYKDEIFRISYRLEKTTDKIFDSITGLKNQLQSLTLNSSLIDEWSRQLDEIFENIKSFKPKTAKERLSTLERRIGEAGIEVDNKIYAKIYYMQGQCFSQLKGMEITNEGAELFIKAYKLNPSNNEYKSNAAFSYLFLKELTKADNLAIELLEEDEFNETGWMIKCFLRESKFEDILQEIPSIVKQKKIFKYHLFQWLASSKYIKSISEFERLFESFDIDVSELIKVTYSNRHYLLVKASYILQRFYENQRLFSNVLAFPDAKKNKEFIYANKILEEVIRITKNSEIEDQHDYWEFQLHVSSFILNEDISHISKMEEIFNRIKNPPVDVVLRMAQGYVKLYTDDTTKKAIQIVEDSHYKTDYFLLLNTFNYLVLHNEEKAKENLIEFINSNDVVKRDTVTTFFTIVRKGQLSLTDPFKEKLEEIISKKDFEDSTIRSVFSIILYIAYAIGFSDANDFYNFLKGIKNYQGFTDQELGMHVGYGFAHLEKFDDALSFLEQIVDFEKPSEAYKLYCKVLFKVEGQKPSLIEHLKKWRTQFVIDPELLDIELFLINLQKNWKELITVARIGLEKYPTSEKLIYNLFSAMNEASDIDGIQASSDLLKNLVIKQEQHGVVIAMALIKGGLHKEALEMLFSLASQKQNTVARRFYITLSIQLPKTLFQDYSLVKIGTFVKYIIDKKKNIVSITESNKDNFPQNLLFNKKPGDVFSFKKNLTGVIGTGVVLRVCDKYLALLEEILIDAEDPISDLGFHVMQFDDDTHEGMLKTLTRDFGPQGSLEKDRKENEFEKYYSGTSSFTEIANSVFNADPIGAYFFLSGKAGKLFRAISPALSKNISLDDTKIVLDYTSICLLYQLSAALKIDFQTKFIIAQNLKESLVKKLEALKSSPRTEMTLNITNERAIPVFYPEDFQEKQIQLVNNILEWVNNNCEIVSVPESLNYLMALKEHHRDDSFFQIVLENKLLADREGYVLLSNDFFYYRSMHSSTNKVISPMIFLKLKVPLKNKDVSEFLIDHNYVGLHINQELLSQEFLKMLGGKENKFSICLENLRYGWNPDIEHLNESIKFIKSLYLLSFLNNTTREQAIISVISNLMIGMPPNIGRSIPQILVHEFKFLPHQHLEVMHILTQFLEMKN